MKTAHTIRDFLAQVDAFREMNLALGGPRAESDVARASGMWRRITGRKASVGWTVPSGPSWWDAMPEHNRAQKRAKARKIRRSRGRWSPQNPSGWR